MLRHFTPQLMMLLATSATVGTSRIQRAVPLSNKMALKLLEMLVLFNEIPFIVQAARMRISKHTSRNMFPKEPDEEDPMKGKQDSDVTQI